MKLLDEPQERRPHEREALLSTPNWREHLADASGMGTWLWERWGSELEPAGMDRSQFNYVLLGYSQELWYWAMGERPWDQFISGLAGRIDRRLPAR
jgi:hypothetical protein